ncbi:MAG: CSLREA domain-containing protein [Actinobacteria bacterium]|nr:CSLREA domain-containing protein [Actinomycetota bacterium]
MGILAAAAAAVVLPGCDPLPPRKVFTVTTTTDGVDAAPGDGVCEVTVGAGDCSLRAAIAEANAVASAEVVVPAGNYSLRVAEAADGDVDLDVTGDVLVRGAFVESGLLTDIVVSTTAPGAAGPSFVVAAGARLELRSVELPLPTVKGSGIEVAGRLVLDHSSIMTNQTPGVDVLPGGVARVTTSSVFSSDGSAIRNAGEVVVGYSSLAGTDAAAIHGEAGSTTAMATTILDRYTWFIHLLRDPTGVMCTGVLPTSAGYNHVPNPSCSLTGPTDVQADDSPATPIPVGVAGCGDGFSTDLYGRPRPTAGSTSCHAGPYEY